MILTASVEKSEELLRKATEIKLKSDLKNVRCMALEMQLTNVPRDLIHSHKTKATALPQ